jgi:hypothetical protein
MTDKFKARVRKHAQETGMSYQAAFQQLSAISDSNEDSSEVEPDGWHYKWLKENPGIKQVNLLLTHNEHGTPTIKVSGEDLKTLQITQPWPVYVAAIRQAYQDNEWAKNPHDDLGDLPDFPPDLEDQLPPAAIPEGAEPWAYHLPPPNQDMVTNSASAALSAWKEYAEETRIGQLAACSTAAQGYATEDNDAKLGSWAHSVAYDDVKLLRARFELALSFLSEEQQAPIWDLT